MSTPFHLAAQQASGVIPPESRIGVGISAGKKYLAIGGLFFAATTGTFSHQVAPGQAQLVPLSDHTHSPLLSDHAYPATTTENELSQPAFSSDTLIRRLHNRSGLTWDQLGRFLGVSRRSVHLWASGGRVNARHTEMISDLARVVDQAPGNTVDERRSWLFSAMPGSQSPMESFLARHKTPGTPVSGVGYTASQLIGSRED